MSKRFVAMAVALIISFRGPSTRLISVTISCWPIADVMTSRAIGCRASSILRGGASGNEIFQMRSWLL